MLHWIHLTLKYFHFTLFLNVSLPLFSSPSFPSMRVNVPANPWWTVETFGTLAYSMSHPKSQREREREGDPHAATFELKYSLQLLISTWVASLKHTALVRVSVWFLHASVTLGISYLQWFHNVVPAPLSLQSAYRVFNHHFSSLYFRFCLQRLQSIFKLAKISYIFLHICFWIYTEILIFLLFNFLAQSCIPSIWHLPDLSAFA